jgi:hypothetical protein
MAGDDTIGELPCASSKISTVAKTRWDLVVENREDGDPHRGVAGVNVWPKLARDGGFEAVEIGRVERHWLGFAALLVGGKEVGDMLV